jgi:hypothetical protein
MAADDSTSTGRTASADAGAPSHNGDPCQYAAPQEAIRRLGRLIAEFREYLSYFLSAKVDSAKASVRRVFILTGLGVIGLIAGTAVIGTAVALLLVGAAWGLGILLGHQLWLGALLVGAVLLGGMVLGAYLMLRRVTRSSRQTMVQKYEHRQNWERDRFGRSVAEQAATTDEK